MISSLTVRARYYASDKMLSSAEQNEYLKLILSDEAQLNAALSTGYAILQSWPSADGNVLNVLLYKPDNKAAP